MTTTDMKEIARGFLTLDQRRRLYRFRQKMHTSLTVSPYVRFLNLLSRSQLVRIKENMQLTGELDYKRGNILMNVDSSFQLMRLRSCSKEPRTIEWIESYFRRGDVFYDVGANVGSYSFVAHVVMGGDCTIYAFEPSFPTFRALCQNVFLNAFGEKIIPLQIALSDKTELSTFNYSSLSSGASMHSIGEPLNQDGHPFQPSYTQTMLSYRLDEFVNQFSVRPPNHIKIDTDGAELKVLSGADQILADPGLRTVLIEVNEKLSTCEELLNFLKSKGLKVQSRHRAGVTEDLYNYIFTR